MAIQRIIDTSLHADEPEEGDVVRLYVEDGGTALPLILRLLDAEKIGVKSMSLSEPTLDDVFLRQTGRSLRDAGPGAGDEGRAA